VGGFLQQLLTALGIRAAAAVVVVVVVVGGLMLWPVLLLPQEEGARLRLNQLGLLLPTLVGAAALDGVTALLSSLPSPTFPALASQYQHQQARRTAMTLASSAWS
jgi:hypothetical protein